MKKKSERMPFDYWKDINNRIGAILGVVDYLGRYPTTDDFTKMNLSYIQNAIKRYDGGFRNFSHKFEKATGYNVSYDISKRRKENEERRREERYKVFEKQYDNLTKKLGHKPKTRKDFYDNDCERLYQGLVHNKDLANRLGYEFKNKKERYNLYKREYDNLTKKLGHKPIGRMDFKGHEKLYTRLKEDNGLAEQVGHEPSYFINKKKQYDFFERQYKELTSILGHKPHGSGDFIHKGYRRLYVRLTADKGLAEHVGHEFYKTQKPFGFWRDWSNVKRIIGLKVDKFYLDNRRLPFSRELKNLFGVKNIVYILKPYGGIKGFYSKLGYQAESLIGLIEDTGSKNVRNFIETHEDVKKVMKYIGKDKKTFAATVFLMYPQLQKSKLLKTLYEEDPHLEEYMGKFITGIRNIKDLHRLSEVVIPYDKDGKIKELLTDHFLESFVYKPLGATPSKDSLKSKLGELDEMLHAM